MTQRLDNPLPLFLDRSGDLLDGGYIYMGEVGFDPEIDPIVVYWDKELTQVADQPLRTRGGYVVNGNTPSNVYSAGDDYSLRVRDFSEQEVLYVSTTRVSTEVFQPLDSDLSSISLLSTTSYGRGLLTLENAAALKAATGIPTPIPAIGGTVTGNITRAGGGGHLYHANGEYTSAAIHVTAAGAADPTTAPGQFWFKKV